MPSLRPSDYKSEEAVAAFLNQYFYPQNVANLQRFTNLDYQYKGIDVQFDFKDKLGLKVDEKAAAHYVNKGLPTFAFELNFIARNGQLQEGWFFDTQKETEYYLLSWIWATKEKGFTVDDITKLEVILIERKVIHTMLESYQLTDKEAYTIANSLRKNKQTGASFKDYSKPYYFFYTNYLSEKPINLIIKKNKLVEWSLLHQFINKK